MPTRVINRVEMRPGVKEKLDKVCQELGMTHVALTSRILEWFTQQDQFAQQTICRPNPPEFREEFARLYSRKRR